jgi:hypothetical protein
MRISAKLDLVSEITKTNTSTTEHTSQDFNLVIATCCFHTMHDTHYEYETSLTRVYLDDDSFPFSKTI